MDEHSLTTIIHEIPAIRQNKSECMQTAAAQALSFFDPAITVKSIIAQVPVYTNEQGQKVGTSPGHMAAYLAENGYRTTAYIFDSELFDRSWAGLESAEIVKRLRARQQYIPDHSWLFVYHPVLVEGWTMFAAAGGRIEISNLGVKLLRQLLDRGPYLLMVNLSYMDGEPRKRYDQERGERVADPMAGQSSTHAVTCAGYRNGSFLIVDPEPPEGVDHRRWIEEDHLIASIMAAQTESANLLISFYR